MSWSISSIDRTALPLALLPTVKSHCRVDFADDDDQLKLYTSVAIGQLENVWGLKLFGLEGEWIPLAVSTTASSTPPPPIVSSFLTPVMPVSAFTAVDADAVDNSALFRLVNKDSYSLPSALETIDGTAFPAGTVVTLQGGYATVAEIPPEMTGIILQITSRLYEFRENAVAFSINQMPMWMNDLLVGLWQPRC